MEQKTPQGCHDLFEEYVEGKLEELERTAKMEKELMKHGKKITNRGRLVGGYMMTVGDLLEFLNRGILVKKKAR